MKVGDTAYIVESNRYVREVEIRRCSGGMFLVRFTDTGGGIQVKAHNKSSCIAERQAVLVSWTHPEKRRYPARFQMLW